MSAERDHRNHAQQGRHRERAGVVVLVVENLDVKRQGVGLAANVSGDDGDRAELAQRAGGAQHHAVEQAPLDVRQRDLENICQPLAPSTSAASSSSVPCDSISGISSRATKGNVTNVVARMMPGTAKMI